MGRLYSLCFPALLIALLDPAAVQGQVADSLTGTWVKLPDSSIDTWGFPYISHLTLYDSIHHRVIIHGGVYPYGIDDDVTPKWFSYSLISHSWSDLGTSGSSFRFDHSAVHGSDSQKVITFGGTEMYGFGSKRNDTWMLYLSQSPFWTQLATRGDLPPPRAGHSAIYDSKRDRMVIWGGYDGFLDETSPIPNEVWALSFSDSLRWSRLDVGGAWPSSRYRHAAVYDPVRNEMLIIGGHSFGDSPNPVWALHFTPEIRWERLNVSGPAPNLDNLLVFWPRYPRQFAFLDESRNRILAYNGFRSIWVLDLGAPELHWQPVSTNQGPPWYFTADYDPTTATMYAAGNNGEVWTFRLDEFVPVEFLEFKASWESLSARVRWTVSEEEAPAEFHVYRESSAGTREKLTVTPLTGSTNYDFADDAPPLAGAKYWVEAIARDGTPSWHGPAVLPPFSALKPIAARLTPNPFRSNPTIHFDLSHSGFVSATVYDLLGREIARPINGEYPVGPYDMVWDGRDKLGRQLREGMYILHVQTQDRSTSIKISRIK